PDCGPFGRRPHLNGPRELPGSRTFPVVAVEYHRHVSEEIAAQGGHGNTIRLEEQEPTVGEFAHLLPFGTEVHLERDPGFALERREVDVQLAEDFLDRRPADEVVAVQAVAP